MDALVAARDVGHVAVLDLVELLEAEPEGPHELPVADHEDAAAVVAPVEVVQDEVDAEQHRRERLAAGGREVEPVAPPALVLAPVFWVWAWLEDHPWPRTRLRDPEYWA